jgi:hypothetical protein
MARGNSGRLVIEVDPNLKRQLHSALAARGTTLKAWLIENANELLSEHFEPRLPNISDKRKPRSPL